MYNPFYGVPHHYFGRQSYHGFPSIEQRVVCYESEKLRRKEVMNPEEFYGLKRCILEGKLQDVEFLEKKLLTNQQFIEIIRIVSTKECKVVKINLPNCGITDEAITDEVVSLLSKSCNLQSINLSSNSFSVETQRKFIMILKENFFLTHFYFIDENTDDRDVEVASELLVRNVEIHSGLRNRSYYKQLLEEVRTYFPTGVDIMVIEYCIEVTNSEAIKYFCEQLIPEIHQNVVGSQEKGTENLVSRLNKLREAFQPQVVTGTDAIDSRESLQSYRQKIREKKTSLPSDTQAGETDSMKDKKIKKNFRQISCVIN